MYKDVDGVGGGGVVSVFSVRVIVVYGSEKCHGSCGTLVERSVLLGRNPEGSDFE